ncbi:hypothetical protein [Bradyrhizobium sp. OAE829]|uniref:hypothetical protein n=1 Tax=Bradyrhizobium sp. OAE829 TaxID=2663807 RepID=UPI00178BD196
MAAEILVSAPSPTRAAIVRKLMGWLQKFPEELTRLAGNGSVLFETVTATDPQQISSEIT